MSAELETALYGKLAQDAALATLAPGGVWRGVASPDADGTVVVFSQAASTDVYALAERAFTESVYQIKAITPGPSARPAWDAAERVEALLTDQPLTLATGSALSCRRETTISITEDDGGEQYQHVGGLYRIYTQE